ncbi:MAG: hypothetical protein ACLFUJ_07590 [Phycisphaerae bacterium]
MNEAESLLCHRCGCDLHPGRGNFYVVRIEAFADPYPPKLDTADFDTGELAAEIDELISQLGQTSEQDLNDQVHRRLTIHLCNRCYRRWIEDPSG